ncbi:MAG: phosphoglycerate kinase [bacterium]|nr:phosphoglycerate kinase [bacterium]
MNLPGLGDLDLKNKNVLLRLDLDVLVEKGKVIDDTRLREAVPTIKYLQEAGAGKITVIGHRGRPDGHVVETLSLEPVGRALEKILKEELGADVEKLDLFMLENLRFNPGEDSGSEEFVKELARGQDVFVNEAFATSHRNAASITKLPKLLPSAAGLHLQEEVENLSKVLDPAAGSGLRPLIFILGGGKMDKALYVDRILEYADWVLVGGVLPKEVKSYCKENGNMCIGAAHLTRDSKDITPDSARNFVQVIKSAGTVVWNGPMGDIDSNHWDGTHAIADALAKSSAFKVVGGGDTIRALQKFGVLEKMNYVSTGGGAMLEFLAYGDLPGLKALRGTA